MPLPDAPKPIISNLYRQLNSDRIDDLDPKKFAIVRNPVFTNDVSEDELRRINVVGQASGQVSSGGPIVNGVIAAKTIEQTSTGDITIFAPGQTPDDNETISTEYGARSSDDLEFSNGVWEVCGISVVQTGTSWTANYKVFVDVSGTKVYLTDLNNSAGIAPIFTETVGAPKVLVSGGTKLGVTVSTVSGSLTKLELFALLARVR